MVFVYCVTPSGHKFCEIAAEAADRKLPRAWLGTLCSTLRHVYAGGLVDSPIGLSQAWHPRPKSRYAIPLRFQGVR